MDHGDDYHDCWRDCLSIWAYAFARKLAGEVVGKNGDIDEMNSPYCYALLYN